MEEIPSLNIPVQRLKVAIRPLDLALLWPCNPCRGNFKHWQVSWKEAGQKKKNSCFIIRCFNLLMMST